MTRIRRRFRHFMKMMGVWEGGEEGEDEYQIDNDQGRRNSFPIGKPPLTPRSLLTKKNVNDGRKEKKVMMIFVV